MVFISIVIAGASFSYVLIYLVLQLVSFVFHGC